MNPMEVHNKKPLHQLRKSQFNSDRRILLQDILTVSENYHAFIETYRDKVLPQKTRTIRLLGRKNAAKIIHTLLGYEVQSSYKRIQCPDLVTAQYLRLFSELGFHSIKIPYDPTITVKLIPLLEDAIKNTTQRIREQFPKDIPTQNYVIRRIYGIIRTRISSL
jgi:hypothetical protein